MKLELNDFTIVQTTAEDAEVNTLISDSPDIENMSEVNLYPKGTPTELTYKIETNNKFIGYVKFTRIRWFNRKAEISVMISKENQGKGYGYKAMEALIKFAFNKMNLHRLEAEVIEFNDISIKLMEKLGFTKEGVLREAKYSDGKYRDIYRYGLLKKEWEARKNG